MYSQLVEVQDQTLDDAKHQEFQQRIDRGEKIEPKDWMPDAYRQTLIRQISQHAHSEIVGMSPERNWLTRSPSLHRKAILLAKIQDEAGHGLYLYSAAETLGVERETLVQNLLNGKAKYSSIFNYPALTWADMGAIGWLVDGAAIINQVSLCKTSYGPYARAMVRICKEESFHQRQGYDILWKLVHGSEAQRNMAQDAVNRWWWPALMMLGPMDSESVHGDQSMKWKIKIMGNEETRQKFLNQTVPQLEQLGLTAPDEQLKYDERTGSYQYGPIDWKEFYRVIQGQGPCNKQRLRTRQNAHDQQRWVSEAAGAYSQSQHKNKKSA